MGKTWKRRGKHNYYRLNDGTQLKPDGTPIGHGYYRKTGFDELSGKVRGSAVRYEKWRSSGCDHKKTYQTLQQAADAKYHYDEVFDTENHVYKCDFCGNYHLTTAKGEQKGHTIIAEKFLPFPSWSRKKQHEPFPKALRHAMKNKGVDECELALTLDVEKSRVENWLSGEEYPMWLVAKIAMVLDVNVEELMHA